MSIFKFLGLVPADTEVAAAHGAAETETVRKIVRELDHLPAERARFVAAFAYILSRVANADLSISDEETRSMEAIVIKHAELPQDQAIIVVQMAKTQSLLFGGTENYLVTREFNRIASREEKVALLHCLFAVSSADHEITAVEDRVIRQIADELLLEHRDYIAVRSSFREHLSVFKQPATPDDAD